jgi:hypothetical protein|eukprot:COSAG06_NODE_4509_length_4193_cov_11.274792_5_plen_395_part_00
MRLLAACTLLAAGANRANAVPTSVRDESRTAVPSSNDLDDDAFTARDGCVTLLESVCRDHRSDVFHCAECAGGHAVELQTAGCSNDAISLWCAGQAPSPAALSRCFIEPAWTREQIVQQKAVPFGQSFNNQTGKMQTLLLDTYEPPASDTRRQRPAFVLIHGGAFIYGNRTSDGEPDVAYALATRGYFVISIEYRLTGYYWGADAQCYWGSTSWAAPCPGTDQTATDAMEDGKAAIRFLRAKASEWRIDPTRIGVAGDSAGAITSNWIGTPCLCILPLPLASCLLPVSCLLPLALPLASVSASVCLSPHVSLAAATTRTHIPYPCFSSALTIPSICCRGLFPAQGTSQRVRATPATLATPALSAWSYPSPARSASTFGAKRFSTASPSEYVRSI